jgi:phosphatidylethanolamine-binding protein (PEBP) family uncharacterized protein
MKIHFGKLGISSPSFSHGERIPDRHAVGEKPTSPPLAWSDPLGGTQSYAFVVHDPDAPLTNGFTHWVPYGIPASTTGIAEGGGDGFVQGLNGRGGHQYVPPAHRPVMARAELLERIDDHIIEQARIVGTYSNLTREACVVTMSHRTCCSAPALVARADWRRPPLACRRATPGKGVRVSPLHRQFSPNHPYDTRCCELAWAAGEG